MPPEQLRDRIVTSARDNLRMRELIAGLDGEVVAAYLARLGLEREPPSVPALHRLVHRQVERVPYETLWIHSGEDWGIEPSQAAARMAREGRGGYCYHLNGALGALLSSLGYDVRGHVGGVHGPDGPDAKTMGNHLVLSVSGLAAGRTRPGSGTSTPVSVMPSMIRCRCRREPTSRHRSNCR